MKAMIIGAAGFVGGYLIDHLRELGWSICASKLPHEYIGKEGVDVFDLDILKEEDISSSLEEFSPDCVFHLAAQSSVALSWSEPALTADVNIKGTLNLLEALRKVNRKPRVLLIGSSEEYGRISENDNPVNEETPQRPGNIYAATKACQGMLGKIFADAYDLDIMMVRAFNHIGPGQSPQFVVSDFCKQTAEIEAGIRPLVIKVGNLSAQRDFTDVRDVVRAYALLMKKGARGETYNIGCGKAVAVEEILKVVVGLSNVRISVEADKTKFRPVDVPVIEADIGKLAGLTGWKPKIALETTVSDTLDYWRAKTVSSKKG